MKGSGRSGKRTRLQSSDPSVQSLYGISMHDLIIRGVRSSIIAVTTTTTGLALDCYDHLFLCGQPSEI
jgi:hypothetical protein